MKKDRETYWRSIIDQQAGSSLSIPVFCREHSISKWNFYQWRKRLTRKETRGFLEIQVPSSFSNTPNTAGLRIRVNENLCIEVEKYFNPTTLRAVIQVLCG